MARLSKKVDGSGYYVTSIFTRGGITRKVTYQANDRAVQILAERGVRSGDEIQTPLFFDLLKEGLLTTGGGGAGEELVDGAVPRRREDDQPKRRQIPMDVTAELLNEDGTFISPGAFKIRYGGADGYDDETIRGAYRGLEKIARQRAAPVGNVGESARNRANSFPTFDATKSPEPILRSGPPNSIDRRRQVELLTLTREARALALRNAESFHEASTVLEHIGQLISGSVQNGLWRYKDVIIGLAEKVDRHSRDEIDRLYDVVREARNMAVHDGAWARHLSNRLIDLFLILEEAIMSEMNLVEDLMVRIPVACEGWHLIAHVRKLMLANSFSNIPIFYEIDGLCVWRLITDTSLVRFIRSSKDSKEKRNRLSMRIGDALDRRVIVAERAVVCRPADSVAAVYPEIEHLPVLVMENKENQERLVGIMTSFDLL